MHGSLHSISVCVGIVLYRTLVNILSGLLQGNLLSPKFFIVFMNKLVRLVVDFKLGCTVYGHYFGIILYADDILLISSSIRKLQSMVDICTNFGFVNGISFGPSKSHCLAIYPGKIHIPCSDIDQWSKVEME